MPRRPEQSTSPTIAIRGGAKARLADKIDAYFDVAVWRFYEMLQTLPDAADLEKGMGPASTEASQELSKGKQVILEEIFRPVLGPESPPAGQVAKFFEQSIGHAKASDISRVELAQFLNVAKAGVVALARDGA